MPKINVSIIEMKEMANTLKQLNLQLTDCLEEMLKDMNQLEAVWQSETSMTIREKFNALSPHFKQYAQVVDAYANYLDETASHYEQTEAVLRQNAESF